MKHGETKISIILSAKDEMSSNIDKAKRSLEAIKKSGVSIRHQLRVLQQNMAELNLVSPGTSSVMTEKAQYAKNLADSIGDDKRRGAYTNDQSKLQSDNKKLVLISY
ncbi:MAG: hypothetical protein J1F38_10905 [Muribaculaceae bacterium]|nr:hypothetical protein [Muribaculaceae bacterium]